MNILEYNIFKACTEDEDDNDELFDSDDDFEEYDEFLAQADLTKGMLIVQFVEYFGITREEFDAANKDENSKEIFNADIVYTFDKELIDEYYGVK